MTKLNRIIPSLVGWMRPSKRTPSSLLIAADAEALNSCTLTLKDMEIIGFLEALDKRIAALEHDLWLARRKITELTTETARP